MKKKTGFLLAALLIAFTFSGCGSAQSTSAESQETESPSEESADQEEAAEEESPEAGTETESEAAGYLFETGGVTLGADMDADEVVAELGEAKSAYEVPSCAGEGIAYLYDYGSYEIETYPDDASGKNLIAYITLKDDTVATAEGIDLSHTKDDVLAAYGEDCEESDNGLIYTKDGMKLEFIFDGEDMISITYVSPAVG